MFNIKKLNYFLFIILGIIFFSCDTKSSKFSSEDSNKNKSTIKTKISGSFVLNSGKDIYIQGGKSKEVLLDLTSIKPVRAILSDFEFSFKDEAPKGVKITFNANNGNIRIDTTKSVFNPKKSYTILATISKSDAKYEGSIEGTITLVVGSSPTFSLTIVADAIDKDGNLKNEYGVQYKCSASSSAITAGTASFPSLNWTGFSDSVENFVLVYQDETSGSKNVGHGIWIISKNFNSLPKINGNTVGKNTTDFIHANLKGISGVRDIVESYYAPHSSIPPYRSNYKFYLFGIGGGLTRDQIKTELDKVKSTTVFNGIGIGNTRNAPSGITDRAAKIKELLGANIIQEAMSAEVGYPKRTAISGSIALSGGATSIEVGQTKEIDLDFTGITPDAAENRTYTIGLKTGVVLPNGVSISYLPNTKKLRIVATVGATVTAQANYRLFATVDAGDTTYQGSVEGTMTLTVADKPLLPLP